MKLLFVSNLFPSQDDLGRGLDHATLLPHLIGAGVEEVHVLALRPTLRPWRLGYRGSREPWSARNVDRPLDPRYAGFPAAMKLYGSWHHKLVARTIAKPMKKIRGWFAFDTVLVSWLYPDACAVASWAEAEDVPFVMICPGPDAAGCFAGQPHRQAITEAIGKSRGLITRSAAAAESVHQAGVDQDKLHPIYNGVDLDVFRPGDQGRLRHTLGLATAAPVILFAGNLVAEKNPLLLVEAWTALNRARREAGDPLAQLVMVGAGELQPTIESAAADAGMAESLFLPGRCAPAAVARYMQAADVLCSPGTTDGVPDVVLESFACGTPVVAADIGGTPEVLDQPELGALVPLGDTDALKGALVALLQGGVDHAAIVDHGRRFTWEFAAGRHAQVLGV